MGSGLGAYNNVYFRWYDSNGSLRRTSGVVPVDSNDDAADNMSLDLSFPAGTYTVHLFNNQNNAEIAIANFEVSSIPHISVISPNGGEIWYGLRNITFNVSDDTGANATAVIRWSANGGITWANITAMQLNTTNCTADPSMQCVEGMFNHTWNTSTVADGSTYLVQVIVDNGAYSSSDQSDAYFTIHNVPFPIATAEAADAVVAYRSNTSQYLFCNDTDALHCPKVRFWNASGGGAWASEIELPSAGSPVRWVDLKWSPMADKIVLVSLSDDGRLDGYVCTQGCSFGGGNWTVSNDIGTVGTPEQRRYAMAFETVTGDLVLAYGINSTLSTRDIAYKILPANSSDFTGLIEHYLDDTGHATFIQYGWLRMARMPKASEEMVLAGFDTASPSANAWVWNGSAWGAQTTIAASPTSTAGYEALAVAYSSDGSGAIALSGDGMEGNVASKRWNGSAWSAPVSFDVDSSTLADVRWANLKEDPASDSLQAVFIDGANALHTAYWNGSSWEVTSLIDATVDSSTRRSADFEWNLTGSVGRLVWDTDGIGSSLSQRSCAPRCTGGTSLVSPYGGLGRWITMYRTPDKMESDVRILSFRLNSNYDIGSFAFKSGGYATYGDSAMTADTTMAAYEAYSFSFDMTDIYPPSIGFIAPTSPNGTTIYVGETTINTSIIDGIGVLSVIMEWNGTNESMAYQGGDNWHSEKTGLAPGTYIYRVWAADYAGNWNSSETRYLIVAASSVPVISFVPPTPPNGTITNQYWAFINATSDQILDAAILEWDGANESMSGSGMDWYKNKTSLGSGVYGYQVFGNTSLGVWGVSETRTITIDLAGPLWSDPSKNATPVYWNTSVLFNTSWSDDYGLAGYIFSINQSGSWTNSSSIQFSGLSNLSENVSLITAAAGTTVGWYFRANDSAGNANQTDAQGFTVQPRPTSLAFSTNESSYPQGRSPGAGYDIYIPFEARFIDSITGQPVTGAACYATNNETGDNITLSYNATTGNYSGSVNSYLMYASVNFTVSCSALNHESRENSTTTEVWFFAYLWNWENRSYGSGNVYEIDWLRKEPPSGPVYDITLEMNLTEGINLFYDFPFCGAGTNCSYLKDYLMDGPETLRMNTSIGAPAASSCEAYLCLAVKDWDLALLDEFCIPGQSIPADTPTQIEDSFNESFTVRQSDYLTMRYYLNCTANATANVSVFFNYTGQDPNFEIYSPQPTQLQSSIVARGQVENNYTVGPNQTANVTRKVWISFNNTASGPRHTDYFYSTAILGQYPDRIISNTTYIYNSTGNLWASDNASAGAPENASIYPDNRISWTTETVPGSAVINETALHGVLDAIMDEETLLASNSTLKRWGINLSDVFFPSIEIANVSVWTNYSTYGAGDDWSFNVSMTMDGNTTDISGEITVDRSAGIVTMPLINLSEVGYVVTAMANQPPQVALDLPPDGSASNSQDVVFNFTATDDQNSTLICSLYLNDTLNQTNSSVQAGALAEFTVSGMDFGWYGWHVNCSDGSLSGTSGTRLLLVNRPPLVDVLSPLGESHYQGSQVSLSVNATDPEGIGTGIAMVEYPDGSFVNLTMGYAQQSDDFSSDTVGTDWWVENKSIGPGQTCIADINGTFEGMAFTSLSGSGSPKIDTFCSFISERPLDGDFDISISFNVTGESASDNAINFQAVQGNSSADAVELVFIALSNWTGYGRMYEVYASGENFSEYLVQRPTNDTYGKMRIVRAGDNFTFYTWDNLNGSWRYENSTELEICRPLYISFEAESSLSEWGAMNATWDDLLVVENGALFADFPDTFQPGLHNVTFFV
ncbi:MAG: hypothetical protein ACOY58_06595, partial [Candidatus Micrarchaeota archaeon]